MYFIACVTKLIYYARTQTINLPAKIISANGNDCDLCDSPGDRIPSYFPSIDKRNNYVLSILNSFDKSN